MRLGLFFNPHYPQCEDIFSQLKALRVSHGLELWGLREQHGILPGFIHQATLAETAGLALEAIIVFGGDGTILRALHFSLEADAPLVGVNLGRLGFLSDARLPELEQVIINLRDKHYNIQERMLLNAVVKRDGEVVHEDLALNDAVIYKGLVPTLIDIRLYCNRRFVLETRCDGIIASTPTGSTAYSLSAGGPILSPVMDAFIVAPLNPHILSVRPMVFGADDHLGFRLRHADNCAVLQLDGRHVIDLQTNDMLHIRRASRKLRFIKLSSKTFYRILRHKLNMGKGNRP
ncbi:MAG: NAD(+)/NADH kinase [Candidatus Cloacimonetes bacterium]|nr:NAD(+)/NADH kinase [Candidatus Cloacimonadota bacterium]